MLQEVRFGHFHHSKAIPLNIDSITDVVYEPNAVLISFLIDILPDGQEPIPCHVKVDLDESIEPMFASWFVEQCEENDWYLSWGYNEMTDSAVATLIR